MNEAPKPARSSPSSTAKTAKSRRRADGGRLGTVLRAPLRFVRRLFFSELRLKHDGKNLTIKLESTLMSTQPASRHVASTGKDAGELRLLCAELKKLLDLHPMARRLMRHLVYVERALQTQGLQVLAEIPVEVLGAAVEQLEALVGNWSNAGLAALRSKMSVAIVDRSRDSFDRSGGVKPSDFDTESRLQVGDVSHSMFLEIERQYQGLVPAKALKSLRVEFASSFSSTQPFAHDEVELR